MIDYGAFILVMVLTIAFCLPFVYFHYKKKQHGKKLIHSFMSKAKEHQLDISSFDLWRRAYVIGIDTKKLKLLYIKFEPEIKIILLDLKKIKKVRVMNEQMEVGTGKEKEKIMLKLWLAFNFVNPNAPDAELEFYNSNETHGLMGEPLLIEKWRNLLHELSEELDNQTTKETKKKELI